MTIKSTSVQQALKLIILGSRETHHTDYQPEKCDFVRHSGHRKTHRNICTTYTTKLCFLYSSMLSCINFNVLTVTITLIMNPVGLFYRYPKPNSRRDNMDIS